MASNKRIFDDVQGLVVNTLLDGGAPITIGGVTAVSINESFADNPDSREDSVQGTSVVSNAGQRVDVDISTTDVMQLVPLLTSVPGSLVCKARESGLPTYSLLEICKDDGGIVIHKGSFSASRSGHASINVGGTARFGASANTFAAIVKTTTGTAAPTIVQPNRLWQPTAMSHIGTSPLAILHAQEVSFDINGRVLTDYGDDDVGITAVDVADYNAIEGRITFRDATSSNPIAGSQLAQQLMMNGAGNLTITLSGVGEVTSKVLTLRNVKFQSFDRRGGKDYTSWQMAFKAQWRDPATPFTIRTLTDVTAAERMINFV